VSLFAGIGLKSKGFDVSSRIGGVEELPPAQREKGVYKLFEMYVITASRTFYINLPASQVSSQHGRSGMFLVGDRRCHANPAPGGRVGPIRARAAEEGVTGISAPDPPTSFGDPSSMTKTSVSMRALEMNRCLPFTSSTTNPSWSSAT
jgi:hypothetical protein